MFDDHATDAITTTDDAVEPEGTRSPAALSDHLADARRRAALDALADADGPLELDELGRRVAATEADLPPPSVPEAHYDRVVADLYERHLPALAADDLVAISRDDGVFVAVDGRVTRSFG